MTGAAEQHTEAHELPPPIQMLHMIGAYKISQAIYVAAKLGIADHVAAGTTSSPALAEATGTRPDRLHRVLRSLAAHGVFTQTGASEWGLTPLAETLRADVPGSMRDMALTWCEEHFQAFGSLLESVREGRPAFEIVYGKSAWEYFAENPDSANTFNRAMGNMVSQAHGACFEVYDFSDTRHLVDVGGGTGHFAAALLARNPSAVATVLDLPHVVAEGPAAIAGTGAEGRITFVEGDFFAEVPAGGDTYLLGFILHDWDDEECERILATVRRAIDPNGKLCALEMVLPPGDEPHFGKIVDLTMMAMLTGKERTAEEWEALFSGAGFRLARIVPTASPISVLEAVPA